MPPTAFTTFSMASKNPATDERPAPAGQQSGGAEIAVSFDRVSLAFDDHVILRDVSFALPRGSMVMLCGASGVGKSLILKLILGLFPPDSGAITVNGHRVDRMGERELMPLRSDIGMLFQESALFDSLTVAENVGYRLDEELHWPMDQVRQRVEEVLGFIGLSQQIDRMPSALSGGQRRRVAIARAMASKPKLLLFDDPTVGLDPLTATSVDEEIIKLRDLEQVTSILVTHQMRDAFYIASHQATRVNGDTNIDSTPGGAASLARFMVLHDGRIWFEGTADELLASEDPHLKEFLYKTLPPW
jgi:phospholipid/cholesterol/gamma-HCH transport system ATP-binding protein